MSAPPKEKQDVEMTNEEELDTFRGPEESKSAPQEDPESDSELIPVKDLQNCLSDLSGFERPVSQESQEADRSFNSVASGDSRQLKDVR